MRALTSDAGTALRALASARGFTAVAVLTLAAALSLAVVVLTVVNAYVIRGLPYPEADRLFRIDYAVPGVPYPPGLAQVEWDSLADVVETPIAWDLDVFFLLGREYPESAPGAWVTPGYLEGFGVRAALGRSFVLDDYLAGAAPVAIISHRLWQTRYGGDAAIVGRTFQAYVSDRPNDAESFTIVGVLPADSWHMNPYSEVLSPLKAPSYPYMARLRPGVSPVVARGRIDALVRGAIASLPAQFEVRLTSALDSYVGPMRPALWAIATAAGLVLLIAAANIAVLMLVRSRHREKELAVRLTLGASPFGLARLVLLEALAIGAAATGLALLASRLMLQAIGPLVETLFERRVPGGLAALAINARVVAAVCVVAILATLVCALVPLLGTRRLGIAPALSASGRGTTPAHARRSHALLIAVEIAASLTLLVGAALVAESTIHMLDVDFGVEADEVVTASLALRQRSFPDAAAQAAFFERVGGDLATLASGSLAALGDWWPLQGSRPRRIATAGAEPVMATANPFSVSSGYFETLGLSLRDGRPFEDDDRLGTELVAVASQSLAARLWPGTRAVGRQAVIHLEADDAPPLTVSIVGVVNDVRQSHSDADLLDLYLPLAQHPSRFAFVYFRPRSSVVPESDLRRLVARLHPEVAVGAPRRLGLGIEEERARPRFLASLLSVLAAIACLVALVGMHGVIAYAVRQRQREIAVRIAVGATTGAVTRLFLRQGSAVLVAGLVAGLAGGLGLGRVLQSQLYGVGAAEPRVLALAALVFAICASMAILWPAWRAAGVDPALALKE